MNAYYHEFTPNPMGHLYFWFILAAIVVMAVLGWAQFKRRGNGAERQFQDKGLATVSGLMSVVLSVMFVTESQAGIIQWFDNGLVGNESPALSVLLGVSLAGVFAALILWAGLYLVGWGSSWIKVRYIWHRVNADRKKMIRKQAQRPVRARKAHSTTPQVGTWQRRK